MLYIKNEDVRRVISMSDAVTCLEQAFSQWHHSSNCNGPRQRIATDKLALMTLSAVYGTGDAFGVKTYFPTNDGIGGHFLLYNSDRELVAVMESDMVGRLRTGAASGVATKALSRPDASSLAIIGTGGQAFAQVSAVCAVRPIRKVFVHSRTADRRVSFCRLLERELSVEVIDCDEARICVAQADIVTTITRSAEPVLYWDWLGEKVHINAAGANAHSRRELDPQIVRKADLNVVDDRTQARAEAAEFRDLNSEGLLDWDNIAELGDVVGDKQLAGTKSLTVFKSLGIGFEDVALGRLAV